MKVKPKFILKESALKSSVITESEVTVISDPHRVANYLKKYSSEFRLKSSGNEYDGTWQGINNVTLNASTGAGPVIDMFYRLGQLGRGAQVLNDESAKKELEGNIEGLKKYGIYITNVDSKYTRSTKTNFSITFNIK